MKSQGEALCSVSYTDRVETPLVLMDLQFGRVTTARSLWSRTRSYRSSSSSSSSSSCLSPLKPPSCSGGDSKQPSRNNNGDNDKGDRVSTDWDKAWSSFRKRGKKTLFSQFNPNKYVSWNPKRSDYPLSEEVDPIKRTERSNLMLWTSPRFTLVGAIIVVSLLLIYSLLAPLK